MHYEQSAAANPIYREVIPRDLTYTTQEMSIHHDPAWYVGHDGALRIGELLAAFQPHASCTGNDIPRSYPRTASTRHRICSALVRRVDSGNTGIERDLRAVTAFIERLSIGHAKVCATWAKDGLDGLESAAALTLEGESYRSPRPMPEWRKSTVATGGKPTK